MRIYLAILLFLPFLSSAEQKVFGYRGQAFVFQVFVTKTPSPGNPFFSGVADSIVIAERSTGNYVQTIVCDDNNYDCTPTDSPKFYVEDMDFDGYDDIRLMEAPGMGSNVPYFYWLYNESNKRFEPSSAFDEIMAPKFNHRKKCVTSTWRSGASSHGTTTYKFISGQLEATDEVEESYNDFEGKTTITTKKRINGQLEVVSTKEEKSEDSW